MKFFLSQWPGIVLGLLVGITASAFAGKPGPSDIVHTIVSQNFYLIQKSLAYQQAQSEMLLLIAEKTKVKPEQSIPVTNRLQQELFGLDLKIKELNR